jgi:hypothetical protein
MVTAPNTAPMLASGWFGVNPPTMGCCKSAAAAARACAHGNRPEPSLYANAPSAATATKALIAATATLASVPSR